MLFIVAGILLLIAIVGPSLWVQHVLRREGVARPDIPGTGAELARHLLDAAQLGQVRVERTDEGDHYDPVAQAVRLSPDHHDGRSVAALAVAAHEVSHAVQHARGETGFRRRQALLRLILPLDRAAQGMLIALPVVFALVHSPALAAAQVGLVMLFLAGRVAIHAVTLPVEFDASFGKALPVEFDASFGKALPVLDRGGYLAPRDLPAARRVLRAAALTYVASALVTVVNVFRWLRP